MMRGFVQSCPRRAAGKRDVLVGVRLAELCVHTAISEPSGRKDEEVFVAGVVTPVSVTSGTKTT